MDILGVFLEKIIMWGYRRLKRKRRSRQKAIILKREKREKEDINKIFVDDDGIKKVYVEEYMLVCKRCENITYSINKEKRCTIYNPTVNGKITHGLCDGECYVYKTYRKKARVCPVCESHESYEGPYTILFVGDVDHYLTILHLVLKL
jgi:hypothetical protein